MNHKIEYFLILIFYFVYYSPGTFSGQMGSSFCDICGLGYFSLFSASECILCSWPSTTLNEGSTSCEGAQLLLHVDKSTVIIVFVVLEFSLYFTGIYLVEKSFDIRNGIVITKIGVLLFLFLPFVESLMNVVYVLYNLFNNRILFIFSIIFTFIVPCVIFISFLFLLNVRPRFVLWVIPPLGVMWIVLGEALCFLASALFL
jgi:hypothetical protein